MENEAIILEAKYQHARKVIMSNRNQFEKVEPLPETDAEILAMKKREIAASKKPSGFL